MTTNPHSATFQRYVVNSIRAVSAQLAALADGLPDEDVQSLALHALDFALPTPAAWANSREALLLLAPKMEQAGLRDGWLPYLQQGIGRSQAQEDRRTEAELNYQLGLLHELRVRFEEALACYARSALLFASLGEAVGEARSINRQAYVARLQQHHSDAIQLVERALTLLPEGAAERGWCYFTWGTITFDHQEWEKAVHWFEQSLAVWTAQEDQRMMARSLRNLGPALQRVGRNEEAITCYTKALTIFERIADPLHQAITRMNLGILYAVKGESRKALELFVLAEPVYRELQDEMQLARLYGNMGYANRQLQQWEQATDAYQTSIRLWRAIGDLPSLINVLDGLGLTLLGRGERGAAALTFQEGLALTAEIPAHPRYGYLRQMLQQHLSETEEGQ